MNTKQFNYCRHYIAYVKWDLILDWKKDEISKNRFDKENQIKPYAHGTSSNGAVNIKKGDILWVITIPKYGVYSSYPSLNARFVIDENINQESAAGTEKLNKIPPYIRAYRDPKTGKRWKYVLIGKEKGSKYFPINNVYNLLITTILKMKSKAIEKKTAGKGLGYIGQHFQPIRLLDEEYGNDFMDYADRITKSDSLFISYRRGKGVKTVKTIVEMLLKEKINCWIDINRMPQYTSDEENEKAEIYFNLTLKKAISESRGFLALRRTDYYQSKWTRKEYILAKRKYKSGGFLFEEKNINELINDEAKEKLVQYIRQKMQNMKTLS